MKVYTKTGDEGKTGLFGGKRVSKADVRIAAYGHVDELNAHIGLLAARGAQLSVSIGALPSITEPIQHELFIIGSHLSTPNDPHNMPDALPSLDLAHTERLEQQIDAMEETLPPLTQFILPGGSELASLAHVARTVCRRAERSVVELSEREEIEPALQQYLNRLSDWLFVLSRVLNAAEGAKEIEWKH